MDPFAREKKDEKKKLNCYWRGVYLNNEIRDDNSQTPYTNDDHSEKDFKNHKCRDKYSDFRKLKILHTYLWLNFSENVK